MIERNTNNANSSAVFASKQSVVSLKNTVDNLPLTGLVLVAPFSMSVSGSGVSYNSSTKTVNFSSATTISVNNCFNYDYTNYKVVFNITGSSASELIKLRLRSNTTDNTGSYSSVGPYYYLSGGTGYSSIVATQASSYFTIGGTPGSTGRGGGQIDFYAPVTTATTTVQYSSSVNIANTGGEWYMGAGIHYVSYSANGFTIFGGNGISLSGSLKIYGYR